jgi:hypothetical protein
MNWIPVGAWGKKGRGLECSPSPSQGYLATETKTRRFGAVVTFAIWLIRL